MVWLDSKSLRANPYGFEGITYLTHRLRRGGHHAFHNLVCGDMEYITWSLGFKDWGLGFGVWGYPKGCGEAVASPSASLTTSASFISRRSLSRTSCATDPTSGRMNRFTKISCLYERVLSDCKIVPHDCAIVPRCTFKTFFRDELGLLAGRMNRFTKNILRGVRPRHDSGCLEARSLGFAS